MKKIMQTKKPQPQPQPRLDVGLSVIFRDNAHCIDGLLKSITGIYKELIFVDTGSIDGTRQTVEAWLKQERMSLNVRAKIVDFTWCDDFAAARMAGWTQLTTTWKMWLDTDDILIGGKEELYSAITKLDEQFPQANLVEMLYDYSNTEKIYTPRLLKGDWGWKYAIHEQLYQLAENPRTKPVRSEKVIVRHTRRDPKGSLSNVGRNMDVAKKHYAAAEASGDLEYKLHLSHAIAMGESAVGNQEEAIKHFKVVNDLAPHHPRGRESAGALSTIYHMQGNRELSTKYAKLAGKSYEAVAAFDAGDYQTCIDKQSVGFFEPYQTTHLCAPIQYGLAQFLLVEAAEKQGFTIQQQERAFNLISKEFRNQSEYLSHTYTFRNRLDKISVLVPATPQPFDETSTNRMLGGSEEAVVYLCRALAATHNRNVTVWGRLPPLSVPGHVTKEGVEYQDFSNLNLDSELGTVVVWRCLSTLYKVLEHVKQNKENQNIHHISFWAHDQLLSADKATNQALLQQCSSVIVLSEFHKRRFEEQLLKPENVNFVILANGIEVADLQKANLEADKKQHKVVYTSCPSRGLMSLMNMWPSVKRRVPEATLDIFYDWTSVQTAEPHQYRLLTEKLTELQDLDVVYHGGVGHERLHKEIAEANVWAYSHFENTLVETFCISAVKATALRAKVITVPNGALPEVVPDAIFCNTTEEYEEALVQALSDASSETERRKQLEQEAYERFGWDAVSKRFSDVWSWQYATPELLC